MRPTKTLLTTLEDLLEQLGYAVRYEKGNFKGGYCIIDAKQMVVVNKFYPLEGRINTLVDVLSQLKTDGLNEEQQTLVRKLTAKAVSA